ncbi:hypothetical protein NPIL_172621, partial [Nephila pilipes]
RKTRKCKETKNIHAPSTETINPSCTYSKDIGTECSDLRNNTIPRSTGCLALSRNKKKSFKLSAHPNPSSDTLSSEKKIVSTEGMFGTRSPSLRQSYQIVKDKGISLIKDPPFIRCTEPISGINKSSTSKQKLQSKETSYSVNNPVKDINQTLKTSIPVLNESHGSDTDVYSVPHKKIRLEKTPKGIKKCSDFSEVSTSFEAIKSNSKMQSSSPKLSDCELNATNSNSVSQNNLLKTVSNSENRSKGTNKNIVLSVKRCHDGSVKLDMDLSRPFKLTLNPTNCQMSCEFDPIEYPFHNTSNSINNSNSSTVLQNESISTKET